MRGGVDHHGTPPHAGDGARLRVDRGDGRVGARPDDGPRRLDIAVFVEVGDPVRDRKSTRLNSSHEWISYAVFCLKKKKTEQHRITPVSQHTLRDDSKYKDMERR